ncbi:MAG: isoaspartyl peptidase/L-asparaginase family protein [Nocardioidaceae bacterium]
MFQLDKFLGPKPLRTAAIALPAAAILTFPVLPGAGSIDDPRSGDRQGDPNITERADNVVFAIHGGAGTILREDLTPELERQYREALTTAVQAGYNEIQQGHDSTDAVEAAINTMEDSPLFNAGKGAVFNTDAENELDASMMDGSTLDAGAVTGTHHIKNPISLSREIMENSRHLMLAGEGAELYAQHRGIDLVTQDYFFTERRWNSLRDAKDGKPDFEWGETNTVGAVGIDSDGDLAAGTSTGGLTNKPVGRIGDSPIIGAGTYADNDTMAASATGTGELFIRQSVTHDISAQMEYAGARVDRAAGNAIDKTEEIGGADSGGVIALDHDKNLAFVFNTAGMYRGYVTEDGEVVVKIFGDE